MLLPWIYADYDSGKLPEMLFNFLQFFLEISCFFHDETFAKKLIPNFIIHRKLAVATYTSLLNSPNS